MTIINDALHWLLSSPPVYWLSEQPFGFALFGVGFTILLIMAYKGMRGPEV
jgi:hypothetical protein